MSSRFAARSIRRAAAVLGTAGLVPGRFWRARPGVASFEHLPDPPPLFAARSRRKAAAALGTTGPGIGRLWRARPRGGSPWPRTSPLVHERGLRQLWAPPDQGTGHLGSAPVGRLAMAPLFATCSIRMAAASLGIGGQWARAALEIALKGRLAMSPRFAARLRRMAPVALGTSGSRARAVLEGAPEGRLAIYSR